MDERRANARYPVGTAVADCRRLPMAWLHGNVASRVLDVSAGGARLVTKEGMAAGQTVRVRIAFPGTVEVIATDARVAWAYDARSGQSHVVGIGFAVDAGRILERVRRPRRRP